MAYELGMMERPWMTPGQDVDRMYEAYSDRLYERMCEEVERNESARYQAFSDVEIAMKKLREARHWIDEAVNEGIDDPLQCKIASYYDQITDLLGWLDEDLKKWEKE